MSKLLERVQRAPEWKEFSNLEITEHVVGRGEIGRIRIPGIRTDLAHCLAVGKAIRVRGSSEKDMTSGEDYTFVYPSEFYLKFSAKGKREIYREIVSQYLASLRDLLKIVGRDACIAHTIRRDFGIVPVDFVGKTKTTKAMWEGLLAAGQVTKEELEKSAKNKFFGEAIIGMVGVPRVKT